MVTNFMIMWWKNLLAVWEVALHFVCKFVKFCTFWQDHRRMGTKLGWEGAGAGGNLFVWKNGACPNAWELKSGWKRTQIAWKTESFTKIFILKACMLIDVYQETQSNNICNLWREIATEKFFLSWHSFSDQLRQKKHSKETFRKNENNRLLGHSKCLFSSFQKNKSLGLRLYISCPCFVDEIGKGNNILIVDFHDTRLTDL